MPLQTTIKEPDPCGYYSPAQTFPVFAEPSLDEARLPSPQ